MKNFWAVFLASIATALVLLLGWALYRKSVQAHSAKSVSTPVAVPSSPKVLPTWNFHEIISEMDGERTLMLTLSAKGDNYHWPSGSPPELFVRCRKGKLDVSIDVKTLMKTDHLLRMKIDDSEPFTESWDESPSGDHLWSADPRGFLKDVAPGKTLLVELPTLTDGKLMARFNVFGLPEELKKLQPGCPVQ